VINTSVFKDWIFTLPWRMQSVLTSSLRGCDGVGKDDPSKFITRGIRSVVLNDADPSNSFITKGGVPDAKMVKAFLWDLDGYPMHFIMHTAHAAEIIGYKHPHKKHRDWWLKFYKKVVVGLQSRGRGTTRRAPRAHRCRAAAPGESPAIGDEVGRRHRHLPRWTRA
jgi:hypothetical protein